MVSIKKSKIECSKKTCWAKNFDQKFWSKLMIIFEREKSKKTRKSTKNPQWSPLLIIFRDHFSWFWSRWFWSRFFWLFSNLIIKKWASIMINIFWKSMGGVLARVLLANNARSAQVLSFCAPIGCIALTLPQFSLVPLVHCSTGMKYQNSLNLDKNKIQHRFYPFVLNIYAQLLLVTLKRCVFKLIVIHWRVLQSS